MAVPSFAISDLVVEIALLQTASLQSYQFLDEIILGLGSGLLGGLKHALSKRLFLHHVLFLACLVLQ